MSRKKNHKTINLDPRLNATAWGVANDILNGCIKVSATSPTDPGPRMTDVWFITRYRTVPSVFHHAAS